jgi:hypothetical protein
MGGSRCGGKSFKRKKKLSVRWGKNKVPKKIIKIRGEKTKKGEGRK